MHRIKRIIGNPGDGIDMGADFNPTPPQDLAAHGTGEYQRGGQAPGKMAAAPDIIISLVFDIGWIIRMAGTGKMERF